MVLTEPSATGAEDEVRTSDPLLEFVCVYAHRYCWMIDTEDPSPIEMHTSVGSAVL